MLTSLTELDGPAVYHLLTQVIVPRPIAWVVSENAEGSPDPWNIAPFSYFNGVASAPALVMFSVGVGLAGRTKDTLQNVGERPLHTIALPHAAQLDAVQATAEPLPAGDSEFSHAGVAPQEWEWPVPRPSGARVALGCRVERIIDIVPEEQVMVISRVELLWVDDAAVSADHRGRTRFDVVALDPLGRLGAGQYAPIGAPRMPSDGSIWSAADRRG
jgi:flavin reductase (DIM6/NTAB) family NADH-FMN oxidoreductase RutF